MSNFECLTWCFYKVIIKHSVVKNNSDSCSVRHGMLATSVSITVVLIDESMRKRRIDGRCLRHV